MLSHSRRLNPAVEHPVGDMRAVRLGRTFDVVIIHDAISYMLTEDDLRGTFATAAAHLDLGGMFITAPDWFAETFPGLWTSHKTRKKEGVELICFEYEYEHDPDPVDTAMETLFLYSIRERGVLRIEMDRHVTGLFPLQTWVDLMTEAGFAVKKREYPVHDAAFLLVGTLARKGT